MQNLPTNNTPDLQEETIDLRKWLGKLMINWYWFVLSIVILGSAAYLRTRYTEPSYSVGATLLIKDETKSMGAEALFAEMDLFGSKSNIQNEIGILKSWTLTRRTLQELNFDISYVATGRLGEKHLYNHIPFRVTVGSDSEQFYGIPIFITLLSDSTYQLDINGNSNIHVTHYFNELFKYEEFNFIISKNPNFDKTDLPLHLRNDTYYFIVNDLDKLAYSYRGGLSVELTDKMGSLLSLSRQGYSPQKEVDFLNMLMDEYIAAGLDEKNKTATKTVEFIENQLLGIVDTLKLAENQLQKFRSENKVIDISSEGQAIMEQIDVLSQEKAMVDLQVKYHQYLLDYLKGNDNFSNVMAPSTMGINDPMLTSLIVKLGELSNEKTSMEYSAKENLPAMQRLNLQIKANQESLQESVRNILENAKLTQTDVNRRISRLSRRISELPETERQLLTIQRKFELQNEIYTYLEQRRAEAAIAQASSVADQIIVDRARVDAVVQVAPRSMVNYALGIMLGFFIPFIIIVLRDFFNHKIQEKSDVESRTDVTIIGSVGHNKKDHMLPAIKYPRSSIAESFRAIRTNLQFSMYKEDKKVIQITSSTSGEGKSFIALNLAGIFSVSNKSTVVVGLDLRKPTVQKYMDLPNKVGVSTYIIGKSSLEEIIQDSKFPNLSIITSGPIPPNPAELFETPEFENFIQELRDRFDIVILDTPPVALVTDAMLIAKYADANLYLVRQKFTHRSAMSFIDEVKTKEHVKKLSIVINDVTVPRYYGYKYGYGYGYGYGKGYGSGYYVDDK
jgi:tyrosine-protein kinase Etk/Wzc